MFADRSAALVATPPVRHAAVCDFDGSPAVVVAGDGSTRVLRWRTGRLRDAAPPPLADVRAVAVVAGDGDGDGRDELLFLGGDRPDRLFAHGPAGWHDLLADPAHRRAVGSGRVAVALDRRGTGRCTFAVAGAGRLRLVEADARGRLLDAAPALGLGEPVAAGGLWAGPLLSDRADLLVLADGPNRLLVNDGTGHLADAAGRCGLLDAGECGVAVAVLDADADGRLDVAWANRDGPHRLLVRQVDGTFRDRASPAFALPGSVRGLVAADFDNCGREELFVLCHGEPNRLFGQTPDGWRLLDPGPATLPDALGTAAVVADLDADGTLELLLAHDGDAPQPLGLFAAPNPNHWLRVRPLTRFGGSARGAVVRVTAGGREQVRVIGGGPNEPVAHFGLGPVSTVEAVAVCWPDGARTTVPGPAVRQTLVVPHPDG